KSVKVTATTTTSRAESLKSISLGAGLYQVCWRRESVKDIATTTTSRVKLSSKQKPSRYKSYGVPRQK
ncbi:24285_t:CDS:2, partial [Gigaspora rosea]